MAPGCAARIDRGDPAAHCLRDIVTAEVDSGVTLCDPGATPADNLRGKGRLAGARRTRQKGRLARRSRIACASIMPFTGDAEQSLKWSVASTTRSARTTTVSTSSRPQKDCRRRDALFGEKTATRCAWCRLATVIQNRALRRENVRATAISLVAHPRGSGVAAVSPLESVPA